MGDAFEATRKLAEQEKNLMSSGWAESAMDSFRRTNYVPNVDMARFNEITRAIKSPPQTQAENVQQAIRRHIDALQQELANDEELQVYCTEGAEKIKVQQIGYPNWHVVILVGTDAEGNPASIITNINSVKLVCKVAKVKPPQKPYHVGFVLPEQKS